jgi:hypothetical protein
VTPLGGDELRARFEALRETERAGAPGFRSLMDRGARAAQERRRRGWRRWPVAWVRLSLAAAIVLAAGLAVRGRRDRARIPPLSTWRSPTAVFLNTPGIELLQSPDVLTSVLDRVASTAVQPKRE